MVINTPGVHVFSFYPRAKSIKAEDILFFSMDISNDDQELSRSIEKLKQDFERLRKERRKLLTLTTLMCIATAVLFFLIGYYFPHP
jgi:hypothetical protein